MQEFFQNAFSGFGITDAVDILIVTFVVYKILGLVMETRAEQILKGMLIFIVTLFLSDLLELHVLNWLCKGAVALGAIAVLIVLQPELRRVLEFMGRGKFMKTLLNQGDKEVGKNIVNQIVKAVKEFSKDKTGALIVFERQTVLEDIAETGTIVDGEITEQLLGNIFYEGSPLHDGAVIISKTSLYAAGCVLPLTKNPDISKNLGTRHRAGIGITENSDALVIIVSEETGIISIAEDGNLERFLDIKTVEKKLMEMYVYGAPGQDAMSRLSRIKSWFGKDKKAETAKEAPAKAPAEMTEEPAKASVEETPAESQLQETGKEDTNAEE